MSGSVRWMGEAGSGQMMGECGANRAESRAPHRMKGDVKSSKTQFWGV